MGYCGITGNEEGREARTPGDVGNVLENRILGNVWEHFPAESGTSLEISGILGNILEHFDNGTFPRVSCEYPWKSMGF